MGSAALGRPARAEEGRPPNVLFIAIDDLRPELGCYGAPFARSPHIDRLAADGIAFTRAYCQQAVCSPSRTSLLTGRRPDTTRVYDLRTHFRRHLPDIDTLPQHFEQQGYHAQSFGKIYHGGLDDPPSWSAPAWFPQAPLYGPGQAQAERLADEARAQSGRPVPRRKGKPRRGPKQLSWMALDCEDHELPDGAIAREAAAAMRRLKDRPFFLAVGFYKPHLPFVAPRRYFDLYDDTTFPLPEFPKPPKGAPPLALTNSGELRQYADIWKYRDGPLDKAKTLELIRAYHAATSYVDAQVGRVLDELDRLGLRDNTVVVLWGDHGWHLGDHGLWCKHTNFERAANAPLIFRAPGVGRRGAACGALTEFVDVYPTLCELCGLPLPEGLEGVSLVPLFHDRHRAWKKAAFSQYPRTLRDVGRVMGHTLRTKRFRFTEWSAPGKDFRTLELYDYVRDPLETVNLASDPDHARVATALAELLHQGWRAALPPGR